MLSKDIHKKENVMSPLKESYIKESCELWRSLSSTQFDPKGSKFKAFTVQLQCLHCIYVFDYQCFKNQL